jgi:hypothetical protein
MSDLEIEYQRKICDILSALDNENVGLATELLKSINKEDIPADKDEFPAPFHLAGLIAGRSIVLGFAGSELLNSEMERIYEGLVDGLSWNMEMVNKKVVKRDEDFINENE